MTEQIRRLYSGYPSMTVTLKTEHQAPLPTDDSTDTSQLRNMEFLNFKFSKLKSKRQEHLLGEY